MIYDRVQRWNLTNTKSTHACLGCFQPPVPHKRILCRHPYDANKRCYVTPSKVTPLHQCVWDGKLTSPFPSAQDIKQRVKTGLAKFREDHLRRLNPTPYKLSVTSDLYTFMHELWLAETPIAEIA